MVIFHSYVKLPEGKSPVLSLLNRSPFRCASQLSHLPGTGDVLQTKPGRGGAASSKRFIFVGDYQRLTMRYMELSAFFRGESLNRSIHGSLFDLNGPSIHIYTIVSIAMIQIAMFVYLRLVLLLIPIVLFGIPFFRSTL